MEHYGARSVQGLREITSVMAAIFAHSVIADEFKQGVLSRWSFAGALAAAALVWFFFDWMVRAWLQRRELAWKKSEAQKFSIEGLWGSLVTLDGEKEPSAVSVLNIHSSGSQLSVEGRTFDVQRDPQGKVERDPQGAVMLSISGDWHSTQAAFADRSLLYQYGSFSEKTAGMCGYTFTWSDAAAPPKGYNGAFFDLGGKARTVKGARAGTAIDLANVDHAKQVAQKVFEVLAKQ
jgi:hypothetical protein